MGSKKKKKPVMGNMEPLAHNPFAALGSKFGVESKEVSPTAVPVKEAGVPQPMLMVRMEKRKKGKVVTCVYHLAADHKGLLKKLKQTLGTGGAVQDGTLELQGDHRKTLPGFLEAEGFKVRLGN